MSERRVVSRLGALKPPAIWRLRLLQSFELSRDGEPLELPVSAQRVVAFLGLVGRPVNRLYAAGMLWPESSQQHANGSLRSALWRLHRSAVDVVRGTATQLSLSPTVEVDFHDLIGYAHRLIEDGSDGLELSIDPMEFTREFLPDWYEDWLEPERERLRQLQLHALEALSARFRMRAEYAQAIEAAQMAVAAEPIRESARRALIEAHLAEGNLGEAIRQFESFRRLLARELGVEPSGGLDELVRRSNRDRVPHYR